MNTLRFFSKQSFPLFGRLSVSSSIRCASCGASAGLFDSIRRIRDGINFQSCWCCSSACFERAVHNEIAKLSGATDDLERPYALRMPIGLILLSHGVITRAQLEEALDQQRRAGHGRLGEWLQRLGYANSSEITRALSVQWRCPMIRVSSLHLDADHSIPLPLMERYEMMPVHYSRTAQVLYIGFSSRISRSALYAIKRTLRCNTEPCVIEEAALRRQIEEVRGLERNEVLFKGKLSTHEMARSCCSYATQVHADNMNIVRCGNYIWSRMQSRSGAMDIIFDIAQLSNPAAVSITTSGS